MSFDILMVILALFLVGLNGLFVAAEFAFVKIRATQVERLEREGRASARLVREATRKLDAYLSVSQLGITISSLGLGWIGEPAFVQLLEPLLEPLGISEGNLHLISFALAFATITFLHVVFGELAPKSVAISKAEGTSLFVAPFMRLFYYLFLPGIYLFNGTANAVVSLFGIRPISESQETHSQEELRILLETAARRGVMGKDEEEMIEGVFELEETGARQVMVPRPDVMALPAGMSLSELFSVAATNNYTRYPVYEGEYPERIVGVVHIRDIMNAVEGAEESSKASLTARDLMREALVVPENKPINEVLKAFQRQRVQMAVVVDEWGAFEGIVTLEDVLEEIVGEIQDEFDEAEEPGIHRLEDGSYSIDGRVPIGNVNETIGSEFESEDFDSIGGLVFGLLGRIPKVGDEVRLDEYVFHVTRVEGPRVVKLLVCRTAIRRNQ